MTDATEAKPDHAREQAAAQFASIREMVEAMNRAEGIDNGDLDWEEEADRLGFVRTVRSEEDDELIWTKEGVTSNAARYGATEEFTDAEDACRTADKEAYPDRDEARERIEEGALSVEVRGGWHTPGDEDGDEAHEYRILLCTGGPAVQITGEIGQHGEPESARIQYQDWFRPWTDWTDGPADEDDILLAYASVFYWGER